MKVLSLILLTCSLTLFAKGNSSSHSTNASALDANFFGSPASGGGASPDNAALTTQPPQKNGATPRRRALEINADDGVPSDGVISLRKRRPSAE